MTAPVIPDLHSALADISAVSAPLGSVDPSHTPESLSERVAPEPDNIHVYTLARAASGALLMGHVSHSSHASHTSGLSHYSHGSHASHTSHASHVSGSHTVHVPGSSTPGDSSSGSGTAAANGRPDLRIGNASGALRGNNVYGSVAHQTVEQAGGRGTKLRWQISVQNDAKVADRIRIRGAKSAYGFKVKYVAANGANVTKAVEAGKFQTPRLASGASYRLTVVVTVTRKATATQVLTGRVQGTSKLTPTRADAVAFVARQQ